MREAHLDVLSRPVVRGSDIPPAVLAALGPVAPSPQ
jgi:hypothetical protein